MLHKIAVNILDDNRMFFVMDNIAPRISKARSLLRRRFRADGDTGTEIDQTRFPKLLLLFFSDQESTFAIASPAA